MAAEKGETPTSEPEVLAQTRSLSTALPRQHIDRLRLAHSLHPTFLLPGKRVLAPEMRTSESLPQ